MSATNNFKISEYCEDKHKLVIVMDYSNLRMLRVFSMDRTKPGYNDYRKYEKEFIEGYVKQVIEENLTSADHHFDNMSKIIDFFKVNYPKKYGILHY